MKTAIASLFLLGLLLPSIAAQLTYYDTGYPPAPASRVRSITKNGGRSNGAAIQQQPLTETDAEEPQEPLVQVATQRPSRNGIGYGQQSVSSRNGNGYARTANGNGYSRIAQQSIYGSGGAGQVVTADEEAQALVDQAIDQEAQPDIGLTDAPISQEVSTYGDVPSITTTSIEDTTGLTTGYDSPYTNGYASQQPLVNGNGQRKVNGNGRRTNGNGQRLTNGYGQTSLNGYAQTTLNGYGNGARVNGNSLKPSNGNGQRVINGNGIGQRITNGNGGQASSPAEEIGDSGEHDHHSAGDGIQWLRDAIRGEPGVDYPIFYTPPDTAFRCSEQQYPGYYADVEARCQVFHICQADGRNDAFLCPNGTVFSQRYFVCVWWYDFDCATAPEFFSLNAQLYTETETSSVTGGPVDGGYSGGGYGGSTAGDTTEQLPLGPQVTELEPILPITEGGDSAELISSEAPIEDLPLTTQTNGYGRNGYGVTTTIATNGYSNGFTNGYASGLKGGRVNGYGAKYGRTNGHKVNGNGRTNGYAAQSLTNGNGKRVNGNGVKSASNGNGYGSGRANGYSNGATLTTLRPTNGYGNGQRKNGNGKRNGNGAVPASPATSGRVNAGYGGYSNGYSNGYSKPNGNGRQRTNGGTKSVYSIAPTVQRTELEPVATYSRTFRSR